MKGSIRLAVGLLLVLGSVGGVDYDPEANLFVLIPMACLGLLIMFSGVKAINDE